QSRRTAQWGSQTPCGASEPGQQGRAGRRSRPASTPPPEPTRQGESFVRQAGSPLRRRLITACLDYGSNNRALVADLGTGGPAARATAAATAEWQAVLDRVRSITALRHLWQRPDLAEISSWVEPGEALVYLIPAPEGCCALVVGGAPVAGSSPPGSRTGSAVRAIALPGVTGGQGITLVTGFDLRNQAVAAQSLLLGPAWQAEQAAFLGA